MLKFENLKFVEYPKRDWIEFFIDNKLVYASHSIDVFMLLNILQIPYDSLEELEDDD